MCYLKMFFLIVGWICLPHTKSLVAEDSDTSSIRFSEHLIADKYAYAYGIAAADFDGDGDLDLSSADYTPHNMLYLFENQGNEVFKKHIIQKDDPETLRTSHGGRR